MRCRGARTGVWREVPLLYVPAEEGAVLLVASNGGQGPRPNWYFNLRAARCVRALVERRWQIYSCTELSGDERAAAWERAVDLYPGYARYQERLAQPIPLLRLQPTPPRVEDADAQER